MPAKLLVMRQQRKTLVCRRQQDLEFKGYFVVAVILILLSILISRTRNLKTLGNKIIFFCFTKCLKDKIRIHILCNTNYQSIRIHMNKNRVNTMDHFEFEQNLLTNLYVYFNLALGAIREYP